MGPYLMICTFHVAVSELAERLATVGLALNLISYLMGSYHMSQVTSASVLNILSGTASLTPLAGAFLSDAYLGRFWMVVLGTVSHFIVSISRSQILWGCFEANFIFKGSKNKNWLSKSKKF